MGAFCIVILHYVSVQCFSMCDCKHVSSFSGVTVACDGSVAGSLHPGFPAALPLSQPAHQRALSAPGEGDAAGTQSIRQRLSLAASCDTHPLSLTQSVRGTDRRSLQYSHLNLSLFMSRSMMSTPRYMSLTNESIRCNINQPTKERSTEMPKIR